MAAMPVGHSKAHPRTRIAVSECVPRPLLVANPVAYCAPKTAIDAVAVSCLHVIEERGGHIDCNASATCRALRKFLPQLRVAVNLA